MQRMMVACPYRVSAIASYLLICLNKPLFSNSFQISTPFHSANGFPKLKSWSSFANRVRLFSSCTDIDKLNARDKTSCDEENDPLNKIVYDTIMRYELKKEILECAETFKTMQEEMFKLQNIEREAAKHSRVRKRDILKRLLPIRRGDKSTNKNPDEVKADMMLDLQRKKMQGLFGATSFSTAMVSLGDKGEEVIELAERLSQFNPTPIPTYGWQSYKGGNPLKDCLLEGSWKLRFTTGADATFRESTTRGKVSTSQDIDVVNGTLTNVIDFEKGNVEGFRVVVSGEAKSDNDITLTFEKIVIKRRKKLFNYFETITIPLPSFEVLKRFAKIGSLGRSNPQQAGFKLTYIDEDFRMHKTYDGNWFIQTRLKPN